MVESGGGALVRTGDIVREDLVYIMSSSQGLNIQEQLLLHIEHGIGNLTPGFVLSDFTFEILH